MNVGSLLLHENINAICQDHKKVEKFAIHPK